MMLLEGEAVRRRQYDSKERGKGRMWTCLLAVLLLSIEHESVWGPRHHSTNKFFVRYLRQSAAALLIGAARTGAQNYFASPVCTILSFCSQHAMRRMLQSSSRIWLPATTTAIIIYEVMITSGRPPKHRARRAALGSLKTLFKHDTHQPAHHADRSTAVFVAARRVGLGADIGLRPAPVHDGWARAAANRARTYFHRKINFEE